MQKTAGEIEQVVPLSWPVSIIASPRDLETHRRCFASIYQAGFRDVTIVAEPGTVMPQGISATWKINHAGAHQGQYRNFIRALRQQLCRMPSGPIITMEDDVILCRRVAAAIAAEAWPSEKCGCIQIYTPAAYAHHPPGRSPLSTEEALDFYSACALMFSLRAAEDLVKWADKTGWRGDVHQIQRDPTKMRGGDTFVGEVLTQLDYEIWVRNPSLADHIGKVSTLGHVGDPPTRRSLNFPGETADAFDFTEGKRCETATAR